MSLAEGDELTSLQDALRSLGQDPEKARFMGGINPNDLLAAFEKYQDIGGNVRRDGMRVRTPYAGLPPAFWSTEEAAHKHNGGRKRRSGGINEEELQQITEVFATIDADGAGTIGFGEFKVAVGAMGFEPEEGELDDLISEFAPFEPKISQSAFQGMMARMILTGVPRRDDKNLITCFKNGYSVSRPPTMVEDLPAKMPRPAPATSNMIEYSNLLRDAEQKVALQQHLLTQKYFAIDCAVQGVPRHEGDEVPPKLDPAQAQEKKAAAWQAHCQEMDEYARRLHDRVQDVVKKIFKEHDTKNNDVLDKDEAAVFWERFMGESVGVEHDLGTMRLRNMYYTTYHARAIYPPTEEAHIARYDKQMQEEVKNMSDEYYANKAERDAAAFKVIDVNGDGTLQLSEFMSAMMFPSLKHQEFLQALGVKMFAPNQVGEPAAG